MTSDTDAARFRHANALLSGRRYADAIESYDQVLASLPEDPAVLINRGVALQSLGRHADALASYERALAAEPGRADALNNRGIALRELKRYEEALASFDHAIAIAGDYADALANRGGVLCDLGRLDEAAVSYGKVLEIQPDNALVHHALIFVLVRTVSDPQVVFDECRRYGEHVERGVRRLPHSNAPDPDRRLAIGYVSGDFREHAAAHFAEPLLRHHDRRIVEVTCYYNHRRIDAVTQRLMRLADRWRPIADLDDDAAAVLVQKDGIDVLVDLSGHTARNRLPLFARKPAPVQVTLFGMPVTTGLTAMDYRLTNRFLDPVGLTERWHTEKLVRRSAALATDPLAALPPVRELPALRNGYVTFASFNDLTKITPVVCALWARVLAAVPSARLTIVCEPAAHTRIENTLRAHGIDPDRLLLMGKRPMTEYLELHNEVDLAFDAFPYNGSTTTRSALSMGVPVVTLAGGYAVSRVGCSTLAQLGLDTFVAATEDDYVRIAVECASNLPELARVRASLRERVHSAALSDARASAAEIESAYRAMWRAWCAPVRT